MADSPAPKTAIDADLMLDYTRVIYADLLDLRRSLPSLPSVGLSPISEPTLAELSAGLAAAPEEEEADEEIYAAPPPQPSRPVPPRPATHQPAPARQSAPQPLPPRPTPPAPAAQQPLPPPPPQKQPAQQEPQHAAYMPPAAEKKDLRRHIGINDKYRFISELFGNDVAAYERAVDAINGMRSRSEATLWMRENLWIREDADAEEVMETFRAAVSAYFG